MRLESPEQLERTIAEAAGESAARAEAMAELAWHLWVTDLPRAERLSRDALGIAEQEFPRDQRRQLARCRPGCVRVFVHRACTSLRPAAGPIEEPAGGQLSECSLASILRHGH